MRVLFYGTPPFALPTLEALVARHQIVGVVTQPDRPAGRGQRPQASAVKQRAVALGLPILQPARLRDPGWPAELARFDAEVAVVVAFGQILTPSVLAVPRRGSINVHASLLPRYRGAAPIAWALIQGEDETGITTFQMDAGMDTGPTLLRRATPIGPDETAGELAERLAELGAATLVETLDRLEELVPQPQDDAQATRAPRLRRGDGRLDWRRPAPALVRLVRGLNPWPGVTVSSPAGRLLIWRARSLDGDAEPGVLAEADGHLAVGTGEGLLLPVEVQPENRRAMAWDPFLRGARFRPGARLGTPDAPA
jgi:methionyl-tRNA formyltransferase